MSQCYSGKHQLYDEENVFLTYEKATWALSPDEQLKKRGVSSGIAYQEDFDKYLKLLLRGLETRDAHTLRLFREWDAAIFPHTKDTGLGAEAGAAGEVDEDDAEMAEAIAAVEGGERAQ